MFPEITETQLRGQALSLAAMHQPDTADYRRILEAAEAYLTFLKGPQPEKTPVTLKVV